MKNSLNFNPSDLIDLSTPARDLVAYSLEFDSYYLEDYDLPTLIEDIKLSRMSFVRTGLIFFKVKYFKLYKEKYSRFKDFCEECCHVSAWQVNRLIEAARVVYNLIAAGYTEVLPTCEAQCRTLTKLPITDLLDVWSIVTNTLEAYEITAYKIEQIVRKYLGIPPKPEHIKIKGDLVNHIKKEAFDLGLTVDQYIAQATNYENEIEEPPLNNEIDIWLNDLSTLNSNEVSLAQFYFKALLLNILLLTS